LLEREVGRSGFGVVWLARQTGPNRLVALKRMRDGELATPSEIRRFVRSAEAAAALEHPNIVPVLHVGEHRGLPFFTMRYVQGPNLAEALERSKPTHAITAGWVAQIARAVQHAHDRGLIHLDLKPANILLDESDTPYVTDFGLARRLDAQGSANESGTVGGAPYYMAPEQIRGEPNRLTVRTDVYALGVLLYELITEEVPYADLEFADWIDAVVSPDPVLSPRALAADVSADLEGICLQALAKEPEHRYQSALALAEDLERFLVGDPPSFRTASSRERALRWLWARRLSLGAMLSALLFLLVSGLRLRATYRAEADVLANEQRENAAMASVQAVAFRFQLLESMHRVAELARQPEIVALIAVDNPPNPSPVLLDRVQGFDTMFVVNTEGIQRGRTTKKSPEYLARSFAFRDYFRGARELGLKECVPFDEGSRARPPRSGYLARTHISESDGDFEFAVSAPICDQTGWVGMIAGTLVSNRGFGAVRIADGHPGRIASLLGPRDVDRKDAGRPRPDDFTFIVHPGLAPGREYVLRQPDKAKIRAALGLPAPSSGLRYVHPMLVPDYRDPIPGYGGSWSAAIAPVDASGFIVLVQSPSDARRPLRAVLADVPLLVGAPACAGIALLLALRLRRRAHR
jgi:serine/threonine-protein kinase